MEPLSKIQKLYLRNTTDGSSCFMAWEPIKGEKKTQRCLFVSKTVRIDDRSDKPLFTVYSPGFSETPSGEKFLKSFSPYPVFGDRVDFQIVGVQLQNGGFEKRPEVIVRALSDYFKPKFVRPDCDGGGRPSGWTVSVIVDSGFAHVGFVGDNYGMAVLLIPKIVKAMRKGLGFSCFMSSANGLSMRSFVSDEKIDAEKYNYVLIELAKAAASGEHPEKEGGRP